MDADPVTGTFVTETADNKGASCARPTIVITDDPEDGNRVDLTLEMKLLEYVTATASIPMETLLNERVNGKAAAMPDDALQLVAESEIQHKPHKQMNKAQL